MAAVGTKVVTEVKVEANRLVLGRRMVETIMIRRRRATFAKKRVTSNGTAYKWKAAVKSIEYETTSEGDTDVSMVPHVGSFGIAGIYGVKRAPRVTIHVENAGGQSMVVLPDTGADVTVIAGKIAAELGFVLTGNAGIQLNSANGGAFECFTKKKMLLRYGKKSTWEECYVSNMVEENYLSWDVSRNWES